MEKLPLDFKFIVEESEISKILISNSSSFSYEIIGSLELKKEVEDFFPLQQGPTLSPSFKKRFFSFYD